MYVCSLHSSHLNAITFFAYFLSSHWVLLIQNSKVFNLLILFRTFDFSTFNFFLIHWRTCLTHISLLTINCLLLLVTDCDLSLLIILYCLFVFFIRFQTSNPNCTFNALDHPMHFQSNSTSVTTLSGFRVPTV